MWWEELNKFWSKENLMVWFATVEGRTRPETESPCGVTQPVPSNDKETIGLSVALGKKRPVTFTAYAPSPGYTGRYDPASVTFGGYTMDPTVAAGAVYDSRVIDKLMKHKSLTELFGANWHWSH
jgi:hypothetical protein